jgi:hypothetical protein
MTRLLRSLAFPCLLTAFVSTLNAAEAPSIFTVSELRFERPEQWEWVEARSSMRKAQLRIPNPDGEPGEVVFFHFGPGNGGGTQANIERWFRQFREERDAIHARTEEATVGDSKVTYVFAEGTYLSGMPGGAQTPKAGYALAGAIIEDPAGHVFVRLTGPKSLVGSSVPEFKKMIGGAKR